MNKYAVLEIKKEREVSINWKKNGENFYGLDDPFTLKTKKGATIYLIIS